MLSKLQPKVPDVGKNNFRDFMRSEKNSIKDHSRSSTQNKTPSTTPYQLILDGSCQTSGKTWDARHLDKFIRLSNYAQRQKYIETYPIKQDTDGVKESYYFKNKFPRFSEEKNASNTFYYSQINHLVHRTEDRMKSKDFIEKKLLNVPRMQIDKRKLQYTPNPDDDIDIYQVSACFRAYFISFSCLSSGERN